MTAPDSRRARPTRPTPRARGPLAPALAACALPLLGGCANLGVQPWERDLLAKPGMALTTSPLDAAIDDHTYFSKEAATGGRGFGGGGCGCN